MSEMILKDHGVCRVHGGGFAGTIQAFVENGNVETCLLYTSFLLTLLYCKSKLTVLEESNQEGSICHYLLQI